MYKFVSFKQLKEKAQLTYINKSYDEMLSNVLCSMFVYDGIEEVDLRFIELYLVLFGKCAFFKNNGKLIVGLCEFAGSPDDYGLGKDLICSTYSGSVKTFNDWKNNDNVVVMFNNTLGTPDSAISWFDYILTEVDTSLKCMILNSRYSPIAVATSESEKIAIDKAFENISNGKPNTIVGNLKAILENGSGNTVEVINITDPTLSDKLQYLSHLHDDLMRRFYTLYGMDTVGAGKMAQQSVSEINSGSNASMIIPHDKLHARLKGIEELKVKFNDLCSNASVVFSECWQNELAKCVDETPSDDPIKEEESDEPIKEEESDEPTKEEESEG